ncbi:glycoside hydrolase family 108 protein [Polycladidibacter hongkongensis]|uniref:glycoside hydrolase family 108 protein n=1 Tax=Polycladidibacter hongkongensis TaxID=1647556 RepID=UPI00083562E5|nr:glycoside hydrolase family 108 protein [Pseudovibrio hongkongensis]
MQASFQLVIAKLLQHEGGYANRPRYADPGGATKYGITRATLSGWLGRTASIADVKALKLETAVAIYKAQYWQAVRADQLPAGVDYAVFDFAVNSGPARAAKCLQQLLGVSVDGVIGAQTLAAAAARPPAVLIREYCAARLAFMRRLKNWRYNKNGWSNRVAEVERAALDLARRSRSELQVMAQRQPDAPKLASIAAKPASQMAKARGEDTSAVEAWKTPEGLATVTGALSGLSGMAAGGGPLQWAFAAVLVIAALVIGARILKKTREA